MLKALTPSTVLVSIQHASNEIGTIQEIGELAAMCRDRRIPLHTDAVASVGQILVDVERLGVDLLTLSGPALGGPKGVGALYFRRNLRLVPHIHGGIQENGRRGGTENLPGIVGLGRAAALAAAEVAAKGPYLAGLRQGLVAGVTAAVPEVLFTGHPERRLPGHASFCFEGVEGEALVFLLSRQGIYANTGSACASKALKVSPVLCAIGLSPAQAQGSLVFTLEQSNTERDLDQVLTHLPPAVAKLRSFSPVWHKKIAAAGAA